MKTHEPIFQQGGALKLIAYMVAFFLFFYVGHLFTSGF